MLFGEGKFKVGGSQKLHHNVHEFLSTLPLLCYFFRTPIWRYGQTSATLGFIISSLISVKIVTVQATGSCRVMVRNPHGWLIQTGVFIASTWWGNLSGPCMEDGHPALSIPTNYEYSTVLPWAIPASCISYVVNIRLASFFWNFNNHPYS